MKVDLEEKGDPSNLDTRKVDPDPRETEGN